MSEPWNDYAGQSEDGPWASYSLDNVPRRKDKSFRLGMEDAMLPALERVAPYSPANLIPGFKEANQKSLAHMKARVDLRKQTQDPSGWGEFSGNLITSLPIMLATKNPFAQGAGMGALNSREDNAQGIATDAAKGAALNWFGGKAVDAVANAVAPVVQPAVRRLAEAGVYLTPGMVKGGKAMVREDKRMSRPVVGDVIAAGRQKTRDTWNIATIDQALEPLGVKVPSPMKPSPETVQWAAKRVSDAYDQVVPNLSVNINGQQFAQTLYPQAAELSAPMRKRFQQLVSLRLKNGQLTGQAVKDAQSGLRQDAAAFRRSQDPEQRKLGNALWAADEELTNALMAQNPQFAPQLQKVNSAYRGMKIVQDAASRADESTFATGQFRDAVRRGDRSKDKGAYVQGRAFMQDWSRDARSVIPARTPDSGTAGRQQAANLFARLGGAADAAGYSAEALMARIALLPRPQQAQALAKLIRQLGPAGGASIEALGNQPVQ